MGAIVGDLAAVEEIFALKDLMTRLGVANLDCRDRRSARSAWGWASYLFNATIAGIEKADAAPIRCANPRGARKRRVLTPASEALAHGRLPDRFDRLAGRPHLSLRLSRRGAADARGCRSGRAWSSPPCQEGRTPGGDRRHGRAGAAGPRRNLLRSRHWAAAGGARTAAIRSLIGSGASWCSTSASCPAPKPRRWWRPARSTSVPVGRRLRHRARRLRDLYRQHTAMRARTGPMSSSRARPTPRNRASTSAPRGACRWPAAPPSHRGETGRSCARCRMRSAAASDPFAGAVARGAVQGASAAAAHRSDRARRTGGYHRACRARRRPRKDRVWPRARRLLSHQSDRAGVRRHGGMLAIAEGHAALTAAEEPPWRNCGPTTSGRWSSSSRRARFRSSFRRLHADPPKISAAVQIRRGPNVVGPWGPLYFRRSLQIHRQGTRSFRPAPTRGCFCWRRSSPPCLPSAWAVISVSAEWEIANLNIGVLYIFAISSLMVTASSWRVVVKLQVSVPRVAAFRRRRWLRGFDRLRHHHRAPVRLRSTSPRSSRRRRSECSTGSGCRCFPCSWCSSFRAGRDELSAVRSGGGDIPELVAGYAVEYLDAVPAVWPSSIATHHVRHGRTIGVPAAAVSGRAIHLNSRG